MRKISPITKLVNKIFGHKYYVAVVGMIGSGEYFVNSTIYRSKEQVDAYRDSLESNSSFMFISCHSFRSHNTFRLTNENSKRVNE